MRLFDRCFGNTIRGIIGKNGPDTMFRQKSLTNLLFNTHNFARGNASTRRIAGYSHTPTIRYHRSRIGF
ncbi:MAG: hypothetical protein KDH96_05335 [Candidatus Riesia sp.]|nr:hypothetical protein [Candidatus Riesia sp.]